MKLFDIFAQFSGLEKDFDISGKFFEDSQGSLSQKHSSFAVKEVYCSF